MGKLSQRVKSTSRLVIIGLSLCIAAVVVACSSTSAPPPASVSVSRRETCDAFAQSMCSILRTCSGLPSVNLEPCLKRESAYCLERSGETLDSIAACGTALGKVACADTGRTFFASRDPSTMLKMPVECEPATGTRLAGRFCFSHAECASGICGGRCLDASCAFGAGVGCGVCAEKRAARGEDCGRTVCAAGLECNSKTRKCVVPGGVGTACGTNEDCTLDTVCAGERCVPATVPANAECGPEQQCDYRQSLSCDGARCVPANITARGLECVVGSACAAGTSCVVRAVDAGPPVKPADAGDGGGSEDGGDAGGAVPAASGTCTDAPTEGQSCTPSTGCAIPNVCLNGRCAAALAASCQ